MKFDATLKPQDKRTIAIVLYIGVVVMFGWYMIRPSAMKLGELDDKIKTAEATKQEYKMKSLQLATAEILYDKAVTDITTSTKDFYDVMDNSKIEKMGTSYILSHGLTPVDFRVDIRDGSFVNEDPYIYSGIKSSKSSTSTESTDATANPTPTSAPIAKINSASAMKMLDVKSMQTFYFQAIADANSTKQSEVQCANITLVIQGSQEKCQALIDDLTKKPSIRVTGFKWADAKEVWSIDEAGNKTLMNPDYKELTINLHFFMTEKPNFEKQEG